MPSKSAEYIPPMPLTLTWEQVALRILLASIASLIIGFNRDERGHPAGMRTTMLVCLAACLAQLQANLLLPTAGKVVSSFVVLDLERLPLGILSGIGFIGAGVIVKRRNNVVRGVTTAATMWYVSVMGLLFGGGQLRLGCGAAVLGVVILWGLRRAEDFLPRMQQGRLELRLNAGAATETELRHEIQKTGCEFMRWRARYDAEGLLTELRCTLRWTARGARQPETPKAICELRALPGVRSLTWRE